MLHMIGNAHLDPVWLWRWQEGVAEAIGTCWAAVDRLDEGDAFVFTRGEAQVYAWIEAHEPALFERIRVHVAAGRWVVVNGWWLQPDCNLPSGEAFIRQALYGKAYFRSRFGVDVCVGYNVDSFGHAHTLPMLLRHTGSDSYVFMRPGPHEMALPGELFDWLSPDGSRVAAFRIAVAYHTSPRQMPLGEKIDRHLAMEADAGHPFMCFYGVGNHGGGPTRESIALIAARQAAGEPVLFSDPGRFFADAAGCPRPEVDGELQFHAIGCYAVASALKKLNRHAEARLEQAEALSVLAMRAAGAPYPATELAELWRLLLLNQFHDTLGGTSIESACEDAVHDLSGVLGRADVLVNAAVRALGRTVRPVAEARDPTLLVVNANPAPLDGLVEAEPWTDFDMVSPRVLLDEDGTPVPFQYVAPEGRTRGLQRVVFRLSVPGCGYRLLRFPADPSGAVPPGVQFGAPTSAMLRWSTPAWELSLDPDTGAISALVDRTTGRPVFAGDAARLVVVDDPTDTWSHGVDRFGTEGEAFSLVSVTQTEHGPLRAAIEVVARSGAGTCTTTILLPGAPGLPVELRFRVDWHGRNKLLRIAFPFAEARFEYEVPAGWSERPDDGREVFGHRWVRAVRPAGAVVLANDAKYSYAALRGTLYVTALRSPVFAHHDPVVLESGRSYRWMDAGEHLWTMRILPGGSRAAAMALSDTLMKPPVVTPHVSRGGTGGHRGQWLAVSAGGTGAVTTLKAAEDGNGCILRAVELDGTPGRLEVGTCSVPLRPRGIVSARLDETGMHETDGLEN